MKNSQLEDNILTQTEVSMQAKIKDSKVNYYSNSITMDSDSGEIGIDNRCAAWILHTTEDVSGELVDPTRRIKGFAGNRPPFIKKGTL